MKKTLWTTIAVLVVAFGAPAANADPFNYSFVGAGFFTGTDVTFQTINPALNDTLYTTTSSTDLFAGGIDYGPILAVEFTPVNYDAYFNSFTELQLNLIYSLSPVDSLGPVIPFCCVADGLGTYNADDQFGYFTIADVPEPDTFLLLSSGLLAIAFVGLKHIAQNFHQVTSTLPSGEQVRPKSSPKVELLRCLNLYFSYR